MSGHSENVSQSDDDCSLSDLIDIASDIEVSDSSVPVEDESSSEDVAEDSSLFSSSMQSNQTLDTSTKESAAASSSEYTASDVDSVKKSRRKRGSLKKGFLKKRKAGRPSSHGSASGEQSEAYNDILSDLFQSGVSEGDDAVSMGYISCVSTLPSDEHTEGNIEQYGEEEVQSKTQARKKRRKKKSIGTRSKYSWRKESQSTDKGEDMETEEVPVDQGLEENQPSPQAIPPTTFKTDVGTSVDLSELSKNALSSLPLIEENISLIIEYLRFTLHDSWAVSKSKDAIIISQIICPENPSVQRAISWSGGVVNILVRNMPLNPNHLLWQIKKPDNLNCGAVADYLTRVSNTFMILPVCSGVVSLEHLWEECNAGVIQRNFEPPCIRHFDCTLLTSEKPICTSCSKLKKALRDKDKRANERATAATVEGKESIPSTVNERFLSKMDLQKKLDVVKKENKLSKQKVRRLQQKVDKLLQEKYEKINSGLSEDFVQIMNENSKNMTTIEKIFWQQQSKALSKQGASKTMRWHPAMIRLALHLRMLSPTAYDFLRGIISLPSQRRLFDYSQCFDVQEGVQQELLEQFKKTVEEKCCLNHQKYFSLLLDEMNIRSDLVYSTRTGELIGFTNLSTLEGLMKELEDEMKNDTSSEKKLAKKVLVYMLSGATNNIRFVPAVFSTDDLSASQLYTRTWEVIYAVEETGAKVIVVIFDGASTNRKFITMNFNFGETNFVHVTMNTASGDFRPLYFILDPPHLIKTFRNCLANSYSHRLSRTLWKNQQQLSWKAIEALYEIIKEDKFNSTKLTKAHVRLTSFSCMKVSLAAQVFSKSVALALIANKDKMPLQAEFTQELVDFILLMNRTFDCLNGGAQSAKRESNCDLLEYTSIEDVRFQYLEKTVLKYLEDWESDVANREGRLTNGQRARMMITYQSMEAMKITIHSFIAVTKFLLKAGAPSVSARNFNQDPLEQYFSTLRQLRGADDNPTLKQVLHSRLSLHAQGQGIAFGGRRGNTEVAKRQLEVDESPLPARKRNKE